VSICATNTINPIRRIVDTLNIPDTSNNDKKLIPLSIGDPTTFGNLKPLQVLLDRIATLVLDQRVHGYQNSTGIPSAKLAIAKQQSARVNRTVTAEDVIITSGCSGALEIAIRAMASAGENILVPAPGFSIYQTIALSNGIEVKFYPLLPERQWEVDIEAMNALVDSKTRAIIVNNPSNPCGSVYSAEHLKKIADAAFDHKLPIIADEIYGNLVFSGHEFHSLAKITSRVPIVHVGGIAKEFLVPGFRVGWIVSHDVPEGALVEVRKGMVNLSQVIIGATSLVQAALPCILTPESETDRIAVETFHSETRSTLEKNGLFLVRRLMTIPGIAVTQPQGAMYILIGTGSMNDKDFSQRLLDEELVFVLPGSCFGIENYVRLVFCAPQTILEDACNRIESFCRRHFK